MSIEKDNLLKDPEAVFTVQSKRKPKAVSNVAAAVNTRPVTFTFNTGAVAGAIKFIKAGDTYTRDNRIEKYPATKITIQVIGMEKPFNMSREIYDAFIEALREPVCLAKIEEWADD